MRAVPESMGGGDRTVEVGISGQGRTEGAENVGRKDFGLAAVGKRAAQGCRAARESTLR
jgi:hypothetical protein